MPTDSTTHGVSTMKHHEEYYLRDGNICFLVENTIFRLHRHFFERESDYFRDRLGPPREGEDGSLNSPFRINDVKSDDFAHFVWVWYNPRYTFSKQEKQKWLTILWLATLWRFGEIRSLAIRHLEKMKLEPIEKITTYKQYSVDSDLLLPSYVSLCTNERLPSPAEAKELTMDIVLRVASARERVLLRASELGCKTPTIASAPEDVVRAIVAESFDLILRSNEGQAMNSGNAPSDNSMSTETTTLKPSSKKGKMNGIESQGLPQNALLQNGVGGGASKGKHKA
jgi:hypothetical protein